jgi:hypothetical protein
MEAERIGAMAIPKLPEMPFIAKAFPFFSKTWEIKVFDAG